MQTYQFDAEDFAKVMYLLAEMVRFHHQTRSGNDLGQFSSEIYPLLREVTYLIVYSKLSDSQSDAISRNDPFSLNTQAEAIATLKDILA